MKIDDYRGYSLTTEVSHTGSTAAAVRISDGLILESSFHPEASPEESIEHLKRIVDVKVNSEEATLHSDTGGSDVEYDPVTRSQEPI